MKGGGGGGNNIRGARLTDSSNVEDSHAKSMRSKSTDPTRGGAGVGGGKPKKLKNNLVEINDSYDSKAGKGKKSVNRRIVEDETEDPRIESVGGVGLRNY